MNQAFDPQETDTPGLIPHDNHVVTKTKGKSVGSQMTTHVIN